MVITPTLFTGAVATALAQKIGTYTVLNPFIARSFALSIIPDPTMTVPDLLV